VTPDLSLPATQAGFLIGYWLLKNPKFVTAKSRLKWRMALNRPGQVVYLGIKSWGLRRHQQRMKNSGYKKEKRIPALSRQYIKPNCSQYCSKLESFNRMADILSALVAGIRERPSFSRRSLRRSKPTSEPSQIRARPPGLSTRKISVSTPCCLRCPSTDCADTQQRPHK
jgi:hypothetical protein